MNQKKMSNKELIAQYIGCHTMLMSASGIKESDERNKWVGMLSKQLKALGKCKEELCKY